MKKKAVIVGCNGQDGRIAYDFLSSKNYDVLGIDRGLIKGSSRSLPIDISIFDDVAGILKEFKPDEVYYFAAFHHSSEDKAAEDALNLFKESYRINVLALLHFLEGMRKFSPKTRLFYAGSSLLFGDADEEIQNESTPFKPETVYGITKLDGVLSCRYYRNSYGIFASTGIFYNHESQYRTENFISKKIIKGALDIRRGKKEKLVLGNLHAEVDWGYAPDYVDAAHRILQTDAPGEFIIATGKLHSVLDLVSITFGYLGLNWKDHVIENKTVLTRNRKTLVGDPSKLMQVTGWRPTVDFREMIRLLLIAEGAEL
jgi:GDPmannose 4,6-dehydratase